MLYRITGSDIHYPALSVQFDDEPYIPSSVTVFTRELYVHNNTCTKTPRLEALSPNTLFVTLVTCEHDLALI